MSKNDLSFLLRRWPAAMQLAGYVVAGRAPWARHVFRVDVSALAFDPALRARLQARGSRAYAEHLMVRTTRQHLLAHGVVPQFLPAFADSDGQWSMEPSRSPRAGVLAVDLDVPGVLPLAHAQLRSLPLAELPAALGTVFSDLECLLRSVFDAMPGSGLGREWLEDEILKARAEHDNRRAATAKAATAGCPPAQQPAAAGQVNRNAPWRLCDVEAIQARKERLKPEREGFQTLEQLEALPARHLPLADAAVVKAVGALRTSFPHFGEVIDCIAEDLTLRVVSGEPVRLPTMLLLGPPGIGKTHFALQLAEAIKGVLLVRSLAETTAGFEITGSAGTWRDSRPGCIARHIAAMPDHRLPLFLFDELDKVGGAESYAVDATLLGLLEPITAQRFRDEFLDLVLDIRPASYLFTANRLTGLRPEIVSRMRLVEIPEPGAEHMPAILRSIDAGLRRDRPAIDRLFAPLPDAVLERLSAVTPRLALRVLERAYARAAARHGAARQGMALTPEDLRLSDVVTPGRPRPSGSQPRRRVLPLLLESDRRVH